MPFQQPDSLRYFTFDLFASLPVTHGIFTRRGGVSPAPWKSLNMGSTVGDDLLRVAENRRRALAELGFSVNSTYDVWQVHSADVVCAEEPRGDVPHIKADAILTDRPGLVIMMRFADCVPILLFDPAKKVVGMVHAGWQGTVSQTLSAAVEKMTARYGTRPADLFAGIGPSIAAHHYPVGPEVVEQVQAAFGSDAAGLLSSDRDRVQFDLWSANFLLLERAGVKNIEVSGLCTACQLDDWFSHRAEFGKTGRFGAFIALK